MWTQLRPDHKAPSHVLELRPSIRLCRYLSSNQCVFRPKPHRFTSAICDTDLRTSHVLKYRPSIQLCAYLSSKRCVVHDDEWSSRDTGDRGRMGCGRGSVQTSRRSESCYNGKSGSGHDGPASGRTSSTFERLGCTSHGSALTSCEHCKCEGRGSRGCGHCE